MQSPGVAQTYLARICILTNAQVISYTLGAAALGTPLSALRWGRRFMKVGERVCEIVVAKVPAHEDIITAHSGLLGSLHWLSPLGDIDRVLFLRHRGTREGLAAPPQFHVTPLCSRLEPTRRAGVKSLRGQQITAQVGGPGSQDRAWARRRRSGAGRGGGEAGLGTAGGPPWLPLGG